MIVDGHDYSGMAGFKFALVNTADSQTFWSNDGTSMAGSEPKTAVTMRVSSGSYRLVLGDTALPNMTTLPEDMFASSEDLWLRVWFDDGVHGSQRLSPDQRLGGRDDAPTIMMVPASSVFTTKISLGVMVNADSLVGGTAGTCQTVGGTIAASVTATPDYALTGISPLTFIPSSVGDAVILSEAESDSQPLTPGNSQRLADHYEWNARTLQDFSTEGGWQAVACSADGMRLAAAQDSGGIFVSSDAGATWTETNAPKGHWYTVASSADGSHLVAALGNGGIYRSNDYGTTWTKTNAPSNMWYMVASSADGSRLVASGFVNLYVSADAGMTWTKTNAPDAGWQGVASSTDGNRLVAVHSSIRPRDGGIYVSIDAGSTWSMTSAPAGSWQGVASSSDGSRLVAVQTLDGGVYVSDDYGSTWTKTGAPKSRWQGVTSSADGSHLIAVQYGGGIYMSANAGLTWARTKVSSGIWQVVAASADGSRLVAGEWEQGGSGVYTAK